MLITHGLSLEKMFYKYTYMFVLGVPPTSTPPTLGLAVALRSSWVYDLLQGLAPGDVMRGQQRPSRWASSAGHGDTTDSRLLR